MSDEAGMPQKEIKTRRVTAITFRMVEMAERFLQTREFVDPASSPVDAQPQIQFPLFGGEMTLETVPGEHVVWCQGGTNDQTIRRVEKPNGDGTILTKIYSIQAILAREQEFEVPIEQEAQGEEAPQIILPRTASEEEAQPKNGSSRENSGEAKDDSGGEDG